MQASILRFDQFELDLESYELRKSGQVVKLEKLPMELLILLAGRRGQLVTREEIIQRLWGDNVFVDTRQGINTAVSKIRLALHDDPQNPRIVQTVFGKGYRLVATSTSTDESLSEQFEPQLLPAPSVPFLLPPAVNPARKFYLLAVGVVIAASAVFWWAKHHSGAPARSQWVQITDFADSATSPAWSPDGRMLAFIRGPETFVTPGQIYVKMLPDGQPVQLTHDDSPKMAPAFSPDGSRIAYTTTDSSAGWNTWVVPVLGGEPEELLPNAAALTWADREHVVFSEIKTSIHMGIATATESRAGERDVYLPDDMTGMAHRSWVSPDGKWILVSEMDKVGWAPCRVLPFDGRSSGET